jgi:hypothetical protein
MNAINLLISGSEFFISRKMSQRSTHACLFSAVDIWHGIVTFIGFYSEFTKQLTVNGEIQALNHHVGFPGL